MSLGELRAQNNCVGIYHLNDNTADSSGGGKNGTGINITYSQAGGKFGMGANFTSSQGSRIELDSLASIFSNTNPHTIFFWLKYTSGAYLFSVNNNLSSGGRGYNEYGRVQDGKIIFTRSTSGDAGPAAFTITSKHNYADGKWYPIMFTFNGSQLAIATPYEYVTASATMTVNTINYFQLGPLINGNSRSWGNLGLTGNMDEVAIFNIAKSYDWFTKQYSLGRFGEL